ncbi:precorrin-6A reductase [Prolixibacteraceae bacterium JC049]|nr:precorrin-6A reductase [Prolixibacteraceae bacterium JC049]
MIWIIGGTSDAMQLVKLVKDRGETALLVSTTTKYGAQLAKQQDVKVTQQQLSQQEMEELITNHQISMVIDASHPFAQVVSENAIAAAKNQSIRYIRFERTAVPLKNGKYYSSYQEIVDELKNTEGNIFLTIGSKNLDAFNELDRKRIFPRVLPVIESIEQCDKAEIPPHQIIASKGLVSAATNKAIMIEYDIKHMVSKDSGKAGGLFEKLDAANELGIPVYILQRPQINYPEMYNDIQLLLDNM